MSFPTSTPARSNDFRMQIYSDSEAERLLIAAQESELKRSLSEIPLTSIEIHSAPRLMRVTPKQSEPSKRHPKNSLLPKTLLGRLPGPLYLIIAAFSKYKAIFNLSLTCRYFWKNLSVERMVDGTTHIPEQVWKNFVMNEYPLDYQHYIQKELSVKSFQDFYSERSIFHHHLRTSNISTFPKLDLPVKVATNRWNTLDANYNSIITISQETPTTSSIHLWNMQTGSELAKATINGRNIFHEITVIRCSRTEIAYGNAEGSVQFLDIEDETLEDEILEKNDLKERSISLIKRPDFLHVEQCVSALALGLDWQAVGTIGGQLIMRQKSSNRIINFSKHTGSVDYLELSDDGCIASASSDYPHITIWQAPCYKKNSYRMEGSVFPTIILDSLLLPHLKNTRYQSLVIRCLHWSSPDRLYSGDCEGTIRVWNPFKGQLLREFKMHQNPISSIQTTQGLIISTGENGRFALTDENGKRIQSILASKRRVKVIGNKIVAIDLKGNVCVSMLNEKSIKVSPRFNKKTIAKTLGVVLLVTAIAMTIFFLIQDRDKN